VSKSTGRPVRKKIYIKKKEPDYETMQGMKMADGFKANAAFFKMSFLDKTSVALGRQFRELLPVLWMKGGALVSARLLKMMILRTCRFCLRTRWQFW
jgi:adenine-specific DNA-methyltransferase